MQLTTSYTPSWLLLAMITGVGNFTALSQAQEADLPEIKFFYFSAPESEWAVSAETAAFEQHRANNSDSNTLYEVHEILNSDSDQDDDALLQESDLEPIPTPALPIGPPLEREPTPAAAT